MKKLTITIIALLQFLSCIMLHAQSDRCETLPVFNDPVERDGDIIPPTLSNPPTWKVEANGKKKEIYFIHGLGGNDGSWSRANGYTTQGWSPFVKTHLIDYANHQKGSLLEAAAAIYSKIDPGVTNDPELAKQLKNNYIIAHSLGGLVSRRLEHIYMNDPSSIRPYGGIVTFGSPHLGAKLAYKKVYQPDEIKRFIELTCKSLLGGPMAEYQKNITAKLGPNSVLIDRLLVIFDETDFLSEKVCEILKKIGFGVAEKLMSNPIEASIATGSQDLALIANTPAPDADIHSVAFYGEEFDNNDMAIRFLYSVTRDPNSYDLMQADAMDDDAIKDYNEHYNKYYEKYKYWLNKAKKNPLGYKEKFFSKKIYTQGDLYDLAYKWKDGVDWLSNLNKRWKWIIGASEIIVDPDVLCYCDCNVDDIYSGYSFNVMSKVDCNIGYTNEDCAANFPSSQDASCEYIEEGNPYILQSFNSDGLVVNQSAMALPNAKYPPVRMVGSSHFQMRNDSELEKALNLLYNTNILGTDYFNLKD